MNGKVSADVRVFIRLSGNPRPNFDAEYKILTFLSPSIFSSIQKISLEDIDDPVIRFIQS